MRTSAPGETLILASFSRLEIDSGGSDSKESACNTGDPGSIPGLGRSPGEGNGYPVQYFCLGDPMDSEAWWATVHGVTQSGQDWAHTHTQACRNPTRGLGQKGNFKEHGRLM